eukprot:scaffold3079_cov119-Cylindrotheca_fusiformis.AAC.2
MRDFVQGKTIPQQVEGNVVELLTPNEGNQKTRSDTSLSLQQEPRDTPRIDNPYRTNATTLGETQEKNRGSQKNFFAPSSRSTNSINPNPYAQKKDATDDPWSNQNIETINVRHALHPSPPGRQSPPALPASTVNQHSRQPLEPKNRNWISESNEKETVRKKKHSFPIFSRQAGAFVPGPVPVDAEASKTWIYPQNDDYPIRQYQLEIAETALFYNTLVSLPTGLGKTLIAAVVLYNYYRWFPTGKLIFMAPTLPLVSQQAEACYNIMGIPESDTAILTGRIKPAARFELWRSRRVFYCTPQTVQKDLLSEEATSFSSQICCIVLDEAHKASGDYAYTKVVEQLELASAKFRIVGLSATPGTTIKAIQQVIQALRSTKIEARHEVSGPKGLLDSIQTVFLSILLLTIASLYKQGDPSVAPYIHQKHSEIVVVPKNDDQKEVERQLTRMLDPVLERLRNQGALGVGAGNATVTAFQIVKSRQEYTKRNDSSNGSIVGYFQAAYKLVELRNDAHHSLGCVKTKMLRLKQTAQRGILSTLIKSTDFQKLFQKVLEATGSTTSGVQSTVDHGNPKLKTLAELLQEHFYRARATEKSSRAIVFSQFRDSVSEVVELLKSFHPLVRARHFVGQQGSKNPGSDTDDSRLGGMKQSEQHQVIKWFRENVYNVLVCTCIGEEGLDIGEVDLIVNFDTLRSPIRMIQRTGRTGRKRDGRVVCLVSEGQEERTYVASKQAEKTLMRALRNPNAFTMAPHEPLLRHKPTLDFSTIRISSKFRMSQVGQANCPRKSIRSHNWRLCAVQEEERGQRFGRVMIPNQDWKEFRTALLRGRRQRPFNIVGGRDTHILQVMERLGPTEVARIHRRRAGCGVIQSLFPMDSSSQQDDKPFFRSRLSTLSSKEVVEPNETGETSREAVNSTRSTIGAKVVPLPIEQTKADSSGVVSHAAAADVKSSGDSTQLSSANVPDVDNAHLNSPKLKAMETADSNRAEKREFDDPAYRLDQETSGACRIGLTRTSLEESNVVDSSHSGCETKEVFRLQTPPSSSDEEDSEEDIEDYNHEEGDVAFQDSLELRAVPTRKEDGNNRTWEESSSSKQNFCFRLPTQESSSSSDDGGVSGDHSASSHFQQQEDLPGTGRVPRFDHVEHYVRDENLYGSHPSRVDLGPAVEPENDSDSESDMPMMSLKATIPDPLQKHTIVLQDSQDALLDSFVDDSQFGSSSKVNAHFQPLNPELKETKSSPEDDFSFQSERTKRSIVNTPGIEDCEMPVHKTIKKRRRIFSDASQSPVRSPAGQTSCFDKSEASCQPKIAGAAREGGSTPHVKSSQGNGCALLDTPGIDLNPEDMKCSVCFSRESSDEDPIVLCDGVCNLGFHKSCYRITVELDSKCPWRCDECRIQPDDGEMLCSYCHGRRRPMQELESGNGWCHPLCKSFSSRATSTKCIACSQKGAVKCYSCAKAIHPYCAIAEFGFGLWTLTLLGSFSHSTSEAALFCPDHTVDVDAFLSERIEHYKDNPPSVKIIQTHQAQRMKPKSLRRIVKKAALPASKKTTTIEKRNCSFTVDSPITQELQRKRREKLDRLKKRRLLLAKFVDDEADIPSEEDVEGDGGEENELRLLEEEDNLSQDSFINNAPDLTQHFSEDEIGHADPEASHDIGYHHRSVDAERVRKNQFKTPVLNRRMLKPEDSQISSTSSQNGLGNMHFIRSVLDHHRLGGEADEIEAVYRQLENEESEHSLEPPDGGLISEGKLILYCSSSDDDSKDCETRAACL